MNCFMIIKKYIEDNGYTALCYPNFDCACGLDDFMPCNGNYSIECYAGYKNDCSTCNKRDNCLVGSKFFYSDEKCWVPEGGE